jgi:hypothetical protein
VLGTHCVDNSPSVGATRAFLGAVGMDPPLRPDERVAYEFMVDFRVHVKRSVDDHGDIQFNENDEVESDGGRGSGGGASFYSKVPYFCLPGSVAEEAIAPSCKVTPIPNP